VGEGRWLSIEKFLAKEVLIKSEIYPSQGIDSIKQEAGGFSSIQHF